MKREPDGGGEPAASPVLERYWASFCAAFVGSLDRRWWRRPLLDRLSDAAIEVGLALVSSPDDARASLDRFSWLLEVAAIARMVHPDEVQRARKAIEATRGMLPRASDRRNSNIGGS